VTATQLIEQLLPGMAEICRMYFLPSKTILNRMNTYPTVAACCFLLLMSGCGGKDKQTAPAATTKPPAKADGWIVSISSLSNTLEVPGSLAPYEETAIQPEIAGRVTGIYFQEGGPVSQGSLMVKLYDEDLQAQMKKLQVQQSIARKTEERQAALLKINGISQQDYDLSLLNVRNLEADIQILQTSIAKTSIRAPFSGYAGLRNISMGAMINPQITITTLRQLSQLKLSFTVPERYSEKVRTGTSVGFAIDGVPEIFKARVIATENLIAAETRSLLVKAQVDQRHPQLVAGAFAKVRFTLNSNEAALMIPTQAIIPQARGKKVMMLRNGLATLESVTTGVRDTALVEITSGLKAGDTILISGLLTTRPGSIVKISNLKNKQP
jgi:membrane fusion protein (multidrug efflux system)